MAITHPSPAEHAHPGPAEYVKVAAVLAVVTAIEVVLYYVKGIPPATYVVTLIVLSATKFFLVAMWFMHLRFDAPIFRRLFVGGLVLAGLVYLVVLLSFRVLTPIARLISKIGN